MGELQQCGDRLNLDIFLLHPQRHKMPISTVCLPAKETKSADGYVVDSLMGRPSA